MQTSGEAETITMGVVPLGTGDDFAKMIPPEAPVGGKPFSWRTAVDKIKRVETKLLDVGRFSVESAEPGTERDLRYFANSTDVGFGAQGAINHGNMPKLLKGFSAYIATALRTLINYPTLPVRIQLDNEPSFEQLTAMTVVMNGRSFGNGFWVCPQASAEDGFFDLMVAEDVNRLTILRLLPKIMKGTHLNEPVLRMYRAQRVVIESSQPLAVESDGEIPYHNAKRLEMEVLHKRLRVLV
jgi:diacylglycerol kinase (ATP)